jgi:hypothetical protein
VSSLSPLSPNVPRGTLNRSLGEQLLQAGFAPSINFLDPPCNDRGTKFWSLVPDADSEYIHIVEVSEQVLYLF